MGTWDTGFPKQLALTKPSGLAWIVKKTDNKKTDLQFFFFFFFLIALHHIIVKSKTFTISLGLPPRAEGLRSLLFEGRRPEGK